MKLFITAALALMTASACVDQGEETDLEDRTESALTLRTCIPHIDSYDRTFTANGRISTTMHSIYFTIRNQGVGTCEEGTRINIYLTGGLSGSDLYSRYVRLPALASNATKSYAISIERTAYDPLGINWTMDSLGWSLYFNRALIMTTP
jgi:hypothetical protein